MRRYTVYYIGPGGFMNWPASEVICDAKIGVVARVMFRKWFGRRSSNRLTWHKNGFMAEARDRRGNICQVEQINGYIGWPQDLTAIRIFGLMEPKTNDLKTEH